MLFLAVGLCSVDVSCIVITGALSLAISSGYIFSGLADACIGVRRRRINTIIILIRGQSAPPSPPTEHNEGIGKISLTILGLKGSVVFIAFLIIRFVRCPVSTLSLGFQAHRWSNFNLSEIFPGLKTRPDSSNVAEKSEFCYVCFDNFPFLSLYFMS